MHIERLIGSVVAGALAGRGKKSRKTLRYLTGGRGSFLNASTLLAVAGVAWGLYETTQRNAAAAASPPVGGLMTPPVPPALGQMSRAASPVFGTEAPAAAGAGVESPAKKPAVPASVERVIRLTVSAARADGHLSDHERAAILEHAQSVEAESIVEDEIARPSALAAIVAGVDEPGLCEELYTLAFAIVRADETISGAERIYLAQLAHALGLDPEAVARLEARAAGRVDAVADEAD